MNSPGTRSSPEGAAATADVAAPRSRLAERQRERDNFAQQGSR